MRWLNPKLAPVAFGVGTLALLAAAYGFMNVGETGRFRGDAARTLGAQFFGDVRTRSSRETDAPQSAVEGAKSAPSSAWAPPPEIAGGAAQGEWLDEGPSASATPLDWAPPSEIADKVARLEALLERRAVEAFSTWPPLLWRPPAEIADKVAQYETLVERRSAAKSSEWLPPEEIRSGAQGQR
jgi:hypothetical protein